MLRHGKSMFCYIYNLFHYINRGDSFIVTYSQLGDIRSLLPSNIHIIALTATATKETLKVVSNRLSLESPVLVGLPPDRKNIFYNVQAMLSVDVFCVQISAEIKSLGLEYP